MKRIALVTGGNRGIGLEVVRGLAERGYTVILGSRELKAGQEAAQSLGVRGVTARQLDVTDAQSIEALRAWTEAEYARLDVLVNNAGFNYDAGNRPSTVGMDEVRRTLETNTLGAWAMAQAFLPLLRKSDAPRLVNVSSEGGSLEQMGQGAPAYSVSKAALNAVTCNLAGELGAPFKVNAVCPGWVRTEMGGADAPRSVREGAASILWAATLDADGPTGGFYRDGKTLAW